MPHVVKVDATEHDVDSVTIYQQRAEVTRIFEVELEAGQSEIEITKLPTCLDESSLRVDGLGNAVIFDVIYERVPAAVNPGRQKSERLLELEKEEAALQREQKVLSSQSRVLDDFSKTLTAKDLDPAQLGNFLNMLGSRGAEYMERQETVDKKVADVRSKMMSERRSARQDDDSSKRAVKVTVVVLAEQPGSAELSLQYVVSNANWTPLYDFRATVEPTGKVTTAVSLSYRASITQNTGENWNNVALELSTSSPLVGAQIPSLHPQRIGPPPHAVGFGQAAQSMRVSMAAPAPPFAMMAARKAVPPGRAREASEDDEAYGMQAEPPAFMSVPTAVAKDGAISASFHIEGLSTIPSDASKHKVAIGVLDLTSDLEWIAVPKQKTSAFLQCQVTNTSPYVLLEGPANVFLDGSFVSRSTIPHVSPQEHFACSVGVDSAIRIEYPPQSKKARTMGSMFSSKTEATEFSQRITIKNTRQTPVKLNVRDQIPISEDAKFKVTVLEPKELGGAPVGKEVAVSPGVTAYWARKDWDKSVADVMSSKAPRPIQKDVTDGQVEWVCQLAPGKSCDLVLAWEVAAPMGEKWAMR